MTGSKLGHYEILDKLGEGGMGMVFKARDSSLGRLAAVKLLPAKLGALEEARKRFVQEAQAASALNHPNIVTIYEIAREAGQDYIAMELVQGAPLAQLIGRTGLTVREAVDLAAQIAAALEAAHAAGIVHRDLKPGNVMVTVDGAVKVLDFGLAKLVSETPSGADDVTRTIVAADAPKTTEGSIVGTVCYMSPEQAEGKKVDHRSDIFSFGALFYEMLTGRRAFHGDSAVSTMAAILTRDPEPAEAVAQAVPHELSKIVARCLRKHPAKRWQSMGDIKLALEEFAQEYDSGKLAATVSQERPRTRASAWMGAALAAALGLAIGAGAMWKLGKGSAEGVAQERWRMQRLTSDTGATLGAAISPDGKFVAYSSDRAREGTFDVWIQQVAGGDPVRLTQDMGNCYEPSFSPDGSQLVFRSDTAGGGVYTVAALGGAPRRIADGQDPEYSPDGAKISYLPNFGLRPGSDGVIFVIPAAGGVPKEVKVKGNVIGRPVWTSDGKGFIFLGNGNLNRGMDWQFVTEDGKTQRPLGAWPRLLEVSAGGAAPWARSGKDMLFHSWATDSANVYRLPLDANTHEPLGPAVTLTVGAGFNFKPTASADEKRIVFGNGTRVASNLWQEGFDERTGKRDGKPVALTEGLERRAALHVSGDGKRIVHLAYVGRSAEVRVLDLATGNEAKLAAAHQMSAPVISRDGERVAYWIPEQGASPLFVVSAKGGVPKKVCDQCGRPVEWIEGTTKLLFDRDAENKRGLWVLDTATGGKRMIANAEGEGLHSPHVSPDGKWLLFSGQLEGAKRRLYIAPFGGGAVTIPQDSWTVAVDGEMLERQPYWAPGGSMIVFLSDRDGSRCVWGKRVELAAGKAVGEEFAIRHFHEVRANLSDMGDPANVGLTVAAGKLFYAVFEVAGNVWMMEKVEKGAGGQN